MSQLIKLEEYKKKVEVLSKEIETKRRRVDTFEYIFVPLFENSIRFIQMRFDENEQADVNRLMRIKSVINKN